MAKVRGRWTLVIPGRASTRESVQKNTHRHTQFTQVRGPRVEVTPLLLPVSLLFQGIRGYKVLLELYNTHKDLSKEGRVLLGCLGFSGGK